jgi:hypothetical protein
MTPARLSAILSGWFTRMAIKHCGRDYGDERLNAYHFYRRVYGLTAIEAFTAIKRWPVES